MTDHDEDFVRRKIGAQAMMSLICLRCGSAVAYSGNPKALAIAQAAHAKVCKGALRPSPSPRK